MAIERITRVEELKEGQNLSLVNRESLCVSGVNDVLSFSDTQIEMDTNMGMLTVKGERLKIVSISTGTKNAEVAGMVSVLEYRKKHEKKSILSGIFK